MKDSMPNKAALLFVGGMVVVLSLALLGLGIEGLLGLGKWGDDEPAGVVRWMVWPIVKAKYESDVQKWWHESDVQKWCQEHFPEHECRNSRGSGLSLAQLQYIFEGGRDPVKSPEEQFQTGIGKTMSLILSNNSNQPPPSPRAKPLKMRYARRIKVVTSILSINTRNTATFLRASGEA